ncbi:MAG TPA: DUF5995 family protein [Silvibacterium sp.]|jgi:hypothetical protein|nr:DUF5995 family protein [Silvibacterium sp.]
MTVAAADQTLYQIVSAGAPQTIDDVLRTMQSIDELLPGTDGLKWFNQLYMTVTRTVDEQPQTAWQDPEWLTRLDVVFAGYYFRAIASFLDGSTTPSAWNALLEARYRTGVDRIQFALAGMNAHINHDLALVLLDTDAQLNLVPGLNSPEHSDYETVNGLLRQVMPSALQVLATGILGELAEDTGKIGRVLAFWDIVQARELAWAFADQLRGLSGIPRQIALDSQDQMTGVLGRAILAIG